MAIPVSSVVSVSISVADKAINVAGFGTPMIVGSSQAIAPDRVRLYNASSWSAAMLADGFVASDAEYRAAAAMMAAERSINKFKVGRRTTGNVPQIVFNVTPTSTEEGTVYSVLVDNETATYTVQASDTVADIIDALDVAITALTWAGTVTDNTTDFDLIGVIGGEENIRFVGPFTIDNTTNDVNTAAQLAEIAAIDNDWYGLIICSQADNEISAAAAWAESNKKRLNACTQSSDVPAGAGLGQALVDSGYNYAKLFASKDPGKFPEASAMSTEFSQLPGTYSLTFKTAPGIAVSNYTASELSNLEANRVGVVESFGGINIIFTGAAASGRAVDTTRFIDWLEANVQAEVANVFVNARGKVPYTDAGIAAIKGAVAKVLQIAERRGAILPFDPSVDITAPRAADVSTTNKANRHLPDMTLQAVYTGAIESVAITGTLSL